MTTTPVLPSVASVLLEHLEAEGITHVFGVVGGLLYPFFRALEASSSLTYVQARHEGGAAFMADGFARSSGRMAVAAATSGPGATNLVTGVACAFADGVPMLVITGNAATAVQGQGASQETNREDIDVVGMFGPITKYSATVTSGATLSHHFRRAVREALSGRMGPVHLNFPVDVWAQPATKGWHQAGPTSALLCRTDAIEATLRGAALVLNSSSRPVILAGSGVASSGAQGDLRELAESLRARVATTPRAKGVLPEDHPLSLGVFGSAGHRAAHDAVLGGSCDVLLVVGSSLGETATMGWNPALRHGAGYLIQCDVDPTRIGRSYPVDMPLVGDARVVMRSLIERCYRNVTAIRMTAQLEDGWYNEPELRSRTAFPLAPQAWRKVASEVMPDDAFVFSDVGGHMLHNIHDLSIVRRQRFFLNLGFGSMGHGTCAPIGAKLACPDRPVVAIIGDGCFAMNGMELITALEHDVAVTWIVENDGRHGVTWHCSRALGGEPLRSASSKWPINACALAAGMGLEVRSVHGANMFRQAFQEALASNRPNLIEVIVDPSVPPPMGSRANTLAGFIGR